jgi:hypothetical protein
MSRYDQGMSDSREDLERALRDIGDEIGRGVEGLTRMARQAGEEITRMSANARPAAPKGPPSPPSPVNLIRELAALKDEGYISEQEYESKKADLLRRI